MDTWYVETPCGVNSYAEVKRDLSTAVALRVREALSSLRMTGSLGGSLTGGAIFSGGDPDADGRGAAQGDVAGGGGQGEGLVVVAL
jgi:hypothetical protein